MPDFNDYLVRIKELNANVVVREARLSDGEDFVFLFNTYYKRKTSIAYFKWQFFNSPYPSKLFVAYESDKLIGYYGVKIYPLSTNAVSGFAVDFLTDEPYRKKGIALLLEAEVVKFCIDNNVYVLTSLPNAFGNAAFKALGWKSVAKIDTLVLEDINTAIDFIAPTNPCDQVSLVAFVKDDEYLKWRFDTNPVYQYEKLSVNEKTFAITKLFTEPTSGKVLGDIVDIKYSAAKDAAQLLSKLILYFKNRSVQSITTWALPHTELYIMLAEAGFKSVEQARYFCIKPLVKEAASLDEISRWNLVQADSEIY